MITLLIFGPIVTGVLLRRMNLISSEHLSICWAVVCVVMIVAAFAPSGGIDGPTATFIFWLLMFIWLTLSILLDTVLSVLIYLCRYLFRKRRLVSVYHPEVLDVSMIYRFVSDKETITIDLFDELLDVVCSRTGLSITDITIACSDQRYIVKPAVYTALDMLIDPSLWASHEIYLEPIDMSNNFIEYLRTETCMFDSESCVTAADRCISSGCKLIAGRCAKKACYEHLKSTGRIFDIFANDTKLIDMTYYVGSDPPPA